MQHDHKNPLSQRNHYEIHHHPHPHLGRHNCTSSDDHPVRQKLGWQCDLHNNSQWGLLMANPADKVEKWDITRLTPYARNSRTHSDEQISQLAASIKEWGWTTPVLVDEDGSIIAGHGRTLAAQRLKMTEVPVMVAKGWSDAKKRAYVIADNKLAMNAGWDEQMLALELGELSDLNFDLELTGFNKKELQSLLDIAEAERIYSDKITVPTYEPKNKKPPIEDLYDDTKAVDLIADIKESKLPQAEKDFLMAAASRHIVFNYSKVADFYSHSSKECQELMEKSALVIVDYKQAIENGFVHLTAQIDDLNGEE
jgi:hypothetical protein